MKRVLPVVSVIIPTHNRCDLVESILSWLCQQTYPHEYIEVLIVIGERVDNTADMVQNFEAPFALRLFQKPSDGPAEKRNHGAAKASGEILIFLDDDMAPESQFIEAHVEAHQSALDRVVIGYFPPVFTGRVGFFEIELRAWWEDTFQAMRQPGHRFTFRDMLSGNFSIRADLFTRVGGFETNYPCRDDYELGMRLLKLGAEFFHCARAKAYHRDTTTANRLFQRKYEEGRADVLLGYQHPELRPVLPMNGLLNYSLLPSRVLRFLAFRWPMIGDAMARVIRPFMDVCQNLRLRNLWKRLFQGLQFYYYWQGVAEKLDTLAEVEKFLANGASNGVSQVPELVLNVGQDLRKAELLLDKCRPHSICIMYNGIALGVVASQRGAEPLRGTHLRPLLATNFAIPLLISMILSPLSAARQEIQQID